MSLLLQSLDIIGTKFSFTINNKRTWTTVFGGILSIVSAAIFIVSFIFLGKDFVTKQNPKTSTASFIQYDKMKIDLTNHNLTIAFNLKKDFSKESIDLIGGFLWADFYQVILNYNNDSILQGHTFNSIPLIKCDSLLNEPSHDFSNEYYCLNLADTAFIGGNMTLLDYTLLMSISFCQKKSPEDNDRTNCRSIDDLKAKFKQDLHDPYNLNIYYPVLHYDSRNKNQPINIKYETTKFTFDYNLQRIDTLFLHNNIINDDIGWLFEDIHQSNYWAVDSSQVHYQYKSNDDLSQIPASSHIYTLQLFLNQTTKVYTRSYMKIQDILVISLAISRFIFVLFQGITKLINSALIYYYIFSHMFEWSYYPSTNRNNSQINQSRSQNNIFPNREQSLHLYGILIHKQHQNQQTKSMTSKRLAINNKKINRCFAIKRGIGKDLICGLQRSIIHHYDHGMKIVHNTMDLDYYIRMIFDVIQLKKSNYIENDENCIEKINLFDVSKINYFFKGKSNGDEENGNVSSIIQNKGIVKENLKISNSVLTFHNKKN